MPEGNGALMEPFNNRHDEGWKGLCKEGMDSVRDVPIATTAGMNPDVFAAARTGGKCHAQTMEIYACGTYLYGIVLHDNDIRCRAIP